MTPMEHIDAWQRVQTKRRDNKPLAFACPECGKLFPYRKDCENHCRACAGGEPVLVIPGKESQ